MSRLPLCLNRRKTYGTFERVEAQKTDPAVRGSSKPDIVSRHPPGHCPFGQHFDSPAGVLRPRRAIAYNVDNSL